MTPRWFYLGVLLTAGAIGLSCADPESSAREEHMKPRPNSQQTAEPAEEDRAWQPQRQAMVRLLRQRGIRDERVLAAIDIVRRHRYIPTPFRDARAYDDQPNRIGHGQTISQPYIVAYMTEALKVESGEKILEIGTGSGYQAAILAAMGAQVYSIEIIPDLAEHAKAVLQAEGYGHVAVLAGDGYQGWPEHAPFDAVMVTCAPDNVPEALVRQLKDGGRMIIPVGGRTQRLVRLRKKDGTVTQEDDLPVRFVPMVRGEP